MFISIQHNVANRYFEKTIVLHFILTIDKLPIKRYNRPIKYIYGLSTKWHCWGNFWFFFFDYCVLQHIKKQEKIVHSQQSSLFNIIYCGFLWKLFYVSIDAIYAEVCLWLKVINFIFCFVPSIYFITYIVLLLTINREFDQ